MPTTAAYRSDVLSVTGVRAWDALFSQQFCSAMRTCSPALRVMFLKPHFMWSELSISYILTASLLTLPNWYFKKKAEHGTVSVLAPSWPIYYDYLAKVGLFLGSENFVSQ